MKAFISIILLLFFASSVQLHCHKFYLTLCNIEQQQNDIKIELKFFMTDLEICMLNESYPSLMLGTGHEEPEAAKYIAEYLKKHFKIKIDKKDKNIIFDGFKASQNCYEEPCNTDLLAVWCNLRIEGVRDINSIEVFSELIVRQYPDHKMVCKIKSDNETKQFILDEDNKTNKVRF